MGRIALACAAALSALGLAACTHYYYGEEYGYGHTHYAYEASPHYHHGYYYRLYKRGYYDRDGHYHRAVYHRYHY